MLVKAAYYVRQLPTQIIMVMPDDQVKSANLTPFRPITESELHNMPALYRSSLTDEIPEYLYAHYGLERANEAVENSDRHDSLTEIADIMADVIRRFGRRKDIDVTYCPVHETNLKEFSDWDRERFHIIAGDEYFFVFETEPKYTLLYAVNISADSLLTAVSELMNLASYKF